MQLKISEAQFILKLSCIFKQLPKLWSLFKKHRIWKLKSSNVIIRARETSFHFLCNLLLVLGILSCKIFSFSFQQNNLQSRYNTKRSAREPCSVYSLHNSVYFSQIHLMGDDQSHKLLCTACHRRRTWHRNIMFVFVLLFVFQLCHCSSNPFDDVICRRHKIITGTCKLPPSFMFTFRKCSLQIFA